MSIYKPINYNSVSPYLVVQGAQRMIELLEKIFNAEALRRHDNPDDSIMHAEVRIDDSIIMVGDAGDGYAPNQSLIHIYVPNIKETFSKAIELGCEAIEKPVHKKGQPDMRGQFKDFAGNTWAIATQVI